jgi:hypothetical protein
VGLESVLSHSPRGLLNDAVASFGIVWLSDGENKHFHFFRGSKKKLCPLVG